MKESSASSPSSAVADRGGNEKDAANNNVGNARSGGTINGTNTCNGNGHGTVPVAPRVGRPHDLVRVSSVDAGRDLTSTYAYGGSYDDVMDGESTSGEDGDGGLAEAERRRLGVENADIGTKSTAVGGGVRGSVRDQLIGVHHPPHLISSSISQQRQPQSQHSSRSNHSSASNSVASSSVAQRRRGSLRQNRHRRRDSYDGEDDFSGSDGESSYFSEHQASPSSSTTPTATAMAAAAAAAKQHASGVPSARPATMGVASNANMNANALPQVPSLGLPYLSHQQQLTGSSMDNLDTSLSFSDDEDDNDIGNGGNTTRLGGISSQHPRSHHNVPRLHRRSSSDEQLQLYTRTVERGTSAQSVSSIVSSSSDEAAGPEPAVFDATSGSRGAPPSVSIPTIPRGAGHVGTPRNPSEAAAYNADGSRQQQRNVQAASNASAEAGMDDSTVFSSATSSSSEFTSSTSSDPSVRSELREIGVQGSFEGAESGRSSGRRKPIKAVGEITGATPSSMDGRQQASSRQSLKPPQISTSSDGAHATVAHPHAKRILLGSQDQMAQTWISMASVPTKPPSSPGGDHSPSRRAATDRSGSVLSSTASRTTTQSDEGHSHYFTTQSSHPSGSTLNMHYSEDDDAAVGGGFSRQVGYTKGNSQGRNGDMNLSEDVQRGNRRAMFADSKISNASGKETSTGDAEGDVVTGGFRVYWRRWLMLMYMSLLNLLSDWTCYSVAPIAVLTSEAFGAIDPESLVTIFLSANAVASGLEPIILGRLGLRRTVVFGSLLLMLGSIVKSGGLPLLMPSTLEKGHGEWRVYLGFFLVGLSQPLYQCTPALLSTSWFPEKERTMATGVALNSNQLGIGFAFVFGTLLVGNSDDIIPYFELLSLVSTLVFVGCALQFDDAPPTPPSDTARVIRGTFEMDIPLLGQFQDTISQSVRYLSKSVRNLGAGGSGMQRSSGSLKSLGSRSSGQMERSSHHSRRASQESFSSGRGGTKSTRAKSTANNKNDPVSGAFRTAAPINRERTRSRDSAHSTDASQRRSKRRGSSNIGGIMSGNRVRTSSEHSTGSLSSSGPLSSTGRPRRAERRSSGGSHGRLGSHRRSSDARRSSGSKVRSSGSRRSSKGGEESTKQQHRRTSSGTSRRQTASADFGFVTGPIAPAPSPAISDGQSTRSAMDKISAMEREVADMGFPGPPPSPMMTGPNEHTGGIVSGPDSGGGGGTEGHSQQYRHQGITSVPPPNSGTPPRPSRSRPHGQPHRESTSDADEGSDGQFPPGSPFPHLQYDGQAMHQQQYPQEYPHFGLEGTSGVYTAPDGQVVYYGMQPPGPIFTGGDYYQQHPQMMMPLQGPPSAAPHFTPYQYGSVPNYRQPPPSVYCDRHGGQYPTYPSLPETENPLDEGAEPVLTLTAHKLDIDIRDDQILVSLRACFSRPGFIHCLASFTVSGIVINSLSTYMDYLVRLGGAGRDYVGIIGGLFQLLIMVSSLVIGSFTDRTRAYYSVSMAMLVLGAFALAECGVNLDEDRGNGLRWSLLLVGILVGPLQPISTELGVDVVYPLSENTVLVIQQLFANLLSAMFIPIFKALKDVDLNKDPDLPEQPEYTFSFYLLIILHAGITFFFATFNGRYLRLEAELEKKRKKEEEEAREAYVKGMSSNGAQLGHEEAVGSFEPVAYDASASSYQYHSRLYYQQQQQPMYQYQYDPYYASGGGGQAFAYGGERQQQAQQQQQQHGENVPLIAQRN